LVSAFAELAAEVSAWIGATAGWAIGITAGAAVGLVWMLWLARTLLTTEVTEAALPD